MGLAMSKFLNTATHFSIDAFVCLMTSGLGSGLTRFFSISGQATASGTETDHQAPLNGDIVITRVKAIAGVNSLNGATTIQVRRNAADIAGASVSIPAGDTSQQDSGALNIAVSAGLVNLEIITGGAAGAIQNIGIEVQYQRVLA